MVSKNLQIVNADNPRDAWDTLVRMYDMNTQARKLQLKQKLQKADEKLLQRSEAVDRSQEENRVSSSSSLAKDPNMVSAEEVLSL